MLYKKYRNTLEYALAMKYTLKTYQTTEHKRPFTEKSDIQQATVYFKDYQSRGENDA